MPQALLDSTRFGDAYTIRIESLPDLIEVYDREVAMLEGHIQRRLKNDPGYAGIVKIPGIGPVIGSVMIADIGDVHRFPSPKQLCSWAGLTPKHHESDTTVRRGRITKQGSKLVRWAAIEAVHSRRRPGKIGSDIVRIAERRGAKIGVVAGARKILTLVYYGLRDGHIRCLELDDVA